MQAIPGSTQKKRIVKTWTTQEIKLLRQLYPTTPVRKLAKLMGRTETGISSYAVKILGIPKPKPKPYTSDEDTFILCNYKKLTIEQMATILDRTEIAVKGRAIKLRKQAKAKRVEELHPC